MVTATNESYTVWNTLSLPDALPISDQAIGRAEDVAAQRTGVSVPKVLKHLRAKVGSGADPLHQIRRARVVAGGRDLALVATALDWRVAERVVIEERLARWLHQLRRRVHCEGRLQRQQQTGKAAVTE